MKDKDFDKIFAHKFGQLPGEPPREEDWADLAVRLDSHRSRRNLLLPVLLPLFGLLAGGNVFWWYQWRQAVENHRPAATPVLLLKRDTIVQTTVIFRFDTVYDHRSVALEPALSAFSTQPAVRQLNPAPDGEAGQAPATSPLSGAGEVSRGEPAPPGGTGTTENKTALPDSSRSAEQPAAPPTQATHRETQPGYASQLMSPVDSAFEQLAEPLLPVVKKTKKPLIYIARPRLGMTAGWGIPLIPHRQSGFLLGAGLGGDVEIARSLRCGIDVQYWNGRLESNETDALRGIEIPDPGDQYEMEYWETYQLPAVTYTLSLRYQISLKSPWKPAVGLGIQAATVLPFDLEFDFEKPGHDLELYAPGQSGAATRWQGMLATAGLERPFRTHFIFGAEAYLLKHFGNAPGLLDNQWGFKTRLFYTF